MHYILREEPMEEITLEQAQENVLRKRQELGVQVTSSPQPIAIAGRKIIERLLVPATAEGGRKIIGNSQPDGKKVRCFLHKTEYPCPICQTGIKSMSAEEETRKQGEQHRREYPEPILTNCGVGKKFLSCSFDSFEGADKTKAILLECIDRGESVVLKGNTGSGKTHLAVAMLRELAKEFRINSAADARVITAPELLMEISATFAGVKQTEQEVVRKYATLPYLLLDDIGAEKSTDWSISRLYMIIDGRCRELLPTLYTTNLSMPDIANHLGTRIASRMAEAKVITLDLPDYRRRRIG